MNGNYILQNLGSLEELDTNNGEDKNVIAFDIDRLNYGLLIYTVKDCNISFLKLSVKEVIFKEDNLEIFSNNCTDEEAFKISLLNVFSLPFTLFKVICTSSNIWAVGQQFALDLKLYVESILEKALLEENDEYMDIDDAEIFSDENFGIPIEIDVQHLHNYDFHFEDIFVRCDSMKHGFIQCHKNSNLNAWQLELISSSDKKAKLPHSFLDFPLSFTKRDAITHFSQGQLHAYDPVILFIQHNDSESHAFRDIFGINCPPPNFLCLVGHPDGKLLWSISDFNSEFHSSDKFQTLYDVKQPIIGIYFIDNIEELEGYGCMLVVGILGQITLFSPKKHPSLTLVPGQHPFWITTAHLKSSITSCAVVKDCLISISNGMLWTTDLSILLNMKKETEEFCLFSNSSQFCSIKQMTVISKCQGLILFLTSSGNIYLTMCKKTVDSDTVSSSLPSLMNECLQQSTVMQELSYKKFLQSRFFTAVSAFASLKFCASTFKESITFTISEVNLEPRKYILVIDFKCFEKLHLDSDLCHVTATVFTYFEKNFSLVTKTAPYIADQPTLCLELTDSVLQPPFVSVFPLFVEVGLILQLPDEWKLIDCFKAITNCLPLYLRVQTFMVHELHLFQSNVLCPPQSFRNDKPKAMKIIEELSLKRPISNILQVESRKELHLPTKFNLCLSMSSVKEMMKSTGDGDPCEYIRNIFLGNAHSNSLSKENVNQNPLSVEITNKNDNLVITLTTNTFHSLIALRIAVMDILLNIHNQNKCLTSSSSFVNIPASIYRKCEDISKSLLSLYGKDVESDEVTDAIIHLYQELRRDVSAKLPIL